MRKQIRSLIIVGLALGISTGIWGRETWFTPAHAGESNETKELKALVKKLQDQLAKTQGELSEQQAVNKALQQESLKWKQVQEKDKRQQLELQAVLQATRDELQKALAISEQARKQEADARKQAEQARKEADLARLQALEEAKKAQAQAEDARKKAEQATVQALTEAKKALAQAAQANAEQAALRAKMELLQTENARLQKLLAALQQQKPQPFPPGGKKDPGKNPPPVQIKGQVTKVDNNLILINLGSDSGLAKNHTLEVYRLEPQPKYLGTIRIVEVKAQQAIGMLTGPAKSDLIKAGDQVSSNILDGK